MNVFIIVIHVIASIALIAIVLLQTGKGAEMGAAFGGASQTLFGGSGGSTFMSKLTTGAAVVFMTTCLLLSYHSSPQSTRSLMEDTPVEQAQPQQPAPVLPEARPVQPEGAASTPAPALPQAERKDAPQQAAPAQEKPKTQGQADSKSPAAKTQQEKAPARK